MKEEYKFWLILVALLVGGLIFLGIRGQRPVKITTAQCPTLAPVIKQEVVEFEGYKCTGFKEGGSTDLLQPSGLWINQRLDCWKLQIPIEEYRKQECQKTGDDYWCKKR